MKERPCWLIATVAGLASLAACNHFPQFGNVALHATVEAGYAVEEFQYTITGKDIHKIDNGTSSSEPQPTFSTLVSHVPVGEGYRVTVGAKSTDGKTTCEGAGLVDVKANATTYLSLALSCKNVGDGEVHILVGVKCPEFQVASYMVSPLTASIGGAISVAASISDTDGGAVDFLWSASAGTFESPGLMQTTYTCTTPGAIVLTVMAKQGPCEDSRMVTVSCLEHDAGID